nr:unnamed protein product [Callosobruchus chinensis]
MQWARAHQGWLLPQWRNVLFSDESRFGLVSDDYRERAWREKGGQNRLATAFAAGKKLGYLFGARKYFSPSNLLTLYKAQIRHSLEYCSHIWRAAAPTTLSILDQSREGQIDSSVTLP